MRLFLDSNIILATVIDDEETADAATALLDSERHAFSTSALNIMELRAVLTKKHNLERDRVEAIISDLLADVDVFLPDSGDVADGVKLQQETLLYPMDALILAAAEAADATLVSFDSELQDHGAIPPSDVE